MTQPCEFGVKSCQWAWGKRICARHGRLWMQGLRLAMSMGRPVELKQGVWVAVKLAPPSPLVVVK